MFSQSPISTQRHVFWSFLISNVLALIAVGSYTFLTIDRMAVEERPAVVHTMALAGALLVAFSGAGLLISRRFIIRWEKAEKALEDHQNQLEEDVRHRTRELLEANRDLQAEIEKRQEVSAQRSMLAAAVEQAAEAIVITDAQGSIEYVNPAFEKMTGYSREEALGKNPRILKSGEHDGDFYHALWRRITQGGTWRGRLENRRKDGNPFLAQTTIRGVRSTGGEIVGSRGGAPAEAETTGSPGAIIRYISVQQDVTEQEDLQAQFLQAQKLEAVGTLASGIAHDFNNILTGILSGVELVKMILPEDSEAQDHLDTVVDETGRAAQLSRKLLDLVRKDEPSGGYLNLSALIPDLVRLLRRSIPATIEIESEIEPGLPAIRGDSGRLEQALLNLAINARDAMPEGGTLFFDVRKLNACKLDVPPDQQNSDQVRQAGDFLRITIRDSGHGMVEEIRKRIFEPFFTTKVMGEGTGLGLAMVYACVQAHQGWITVDSNLESGTEFKIYLPATPPGERPEHITVGEGMAEGEETILCVDDSEAVLRAESRALERLGYRVIQARDGEQALAELERHGRSIKLLVTDIVMPRLGGRELLKQLRESGYSMPVLATSGYSPGTSDDLIKEGFAAFLGKPFQISELVWKVRDVLDAEGLSTERNR